MMGKKRNSLSILILLIALQSFSQQFRNTAILPVVNADSFYSIPITPELSSYLKTDLSDIRIADEKGQWVPHFIRPGNEKMMMEYAYPKLSINQQINENGKTTLILENEEKRPFSIIYLKIKNSNSNRNAILSGCDDAQNWFAITDTFTLPKPDNADKNSMTFGIYFPLINYKYIKLTIFNKGNDPFNIIEALQNLPGEFPPIKYISNPSLSFSQFDTTGYTLLKVANRNRVQYSKFSVSVAGPRYYNRRIKFFSSNEAKSLDDLKKSTANKEFIFSSGNVIDYETSLQNDSLFYLLVENNDNPPLQFTGVETKQPSRMLIAYLEKDKKYKLLFNDSAANAPTYDLSNFRESIEPGLQQLKFGTIESVNKPKEIFQQKKDLKKWLWPSIIIILALLSYFTWTLSKDIKKRNNNS